MAFFHNGRTMHVESAPHAHRISHSSLASHRSVSPAARQILRQTLRRRRNALPNVARRAAALRIARFLHAHVLRPGLRIAFYAAFDGEIDMAPTAQLAQRLKCSLFAPVITDKSKRQ